MQDLVLLIMLTSSYFLHFLSSPVKQRPVAAAASRVQCCKAVASTLKPEGFGNTQAKEKIAESRRQCTSEDDMCSV